MRKPDGRKVGDRVVVTYRRREYAGTITHVGRVGYEVQLDETGELWHRPDGEIYDGFNDGRSP